MMNSDNESNYNGGGNDRDLFFSRSIKAGKRVYYLDVKRDRRGEYYIAMTESRRVQDGTETDRPVFEKHKIFLYREDILGFLAAFTEAAKYVGENRPLTAQTRRPYNGERRPYAAEGNAPVAPEASAEATAPEAPTYGEAPVYEEAPAYEEAPVYEETASCPEPEAPAEPEVPAESSKKGFFSSLGFGF